MRTQMHKITIVYSGHRQNGLCNAGALLEILRALEPEVVFEEMSPSDFDSYYKHRTKSSLESQAIIGYHQVKAFQQVPVDLHMPASRLVEIKSDVDRVLDRVEHTNQEYQELDEEKGNRTHHGGFQYLNGAAFTKMMTRMCEIEEKTITQTGDQGLVRALERWRHANHEREVEMVGNIYRYCRENVFDTGVFLLGAAHKTSIVKEIEKHASTEADLISWNFSFDARIS